MTFVIGFIVLVLIAWFVVWLVSPYPRQPKRNSGQQSQGFSIDFPDFFD